MSETCYTQSIRCVHKSLASRVIRNAARKVGVEIASPIPGAVSNRLGEQHVANFLAHGMAAWDGSSRSVSRSSAQVEDMRVHERRIDARCEDWRGSRTHKVSNALDLIDCGGTRECQAPTRSRIAPRPLHVAVTPLSRTSTPNAPCDFTCSRLPPGTHDGHVICSLLLAHVHGDTYDQHIHRHAANPAATAVVR